MLINNTRFRRRVYVRVWHVSYRNKPAINIMTCAFHNIASYELSTPWRDGGSCIARAPINDGGEIAAALSNKISSFYRRETGKS